MNDIKKQALGRGLSALFNATGEDERENIHTHLITIPINSISPSLDQPRHYFPEDELLALSASIRERGVLQPILVRVHPKKNGQYEIVAGERRWRAAQRAGLEVIPALVKEYSDSETLEVGLLENIQRQDLNSIEEADAYRRLIEGYGHTQESLAQTLGKSRSHIANTLRLLTLPLSVKIALKKGNLSAGHGRALIGLENAEILAKVIMEKNLSVRQAEELAKKKVPQDLFKNEPRPQDPEKDVLRHHLSELLGVPVEIQFNGNSGKIMIYFKNPTDLDKIIQKLNG